MLSFHEMLFAFRSLASCKTHPGLPGVVSVNVLLMLFWLYRALKHECQMLLFSATYNTEVMTFAQAIIKDPILIRLRKDEESLDNIKQFFIACDR